MKTDSGARTSRTTQLMMHRTAFSCEILERRTVNVNEFMKQMRQAKKDGVITGEEEIIFDFNRGHNPEVVTNVRTLNNWFKKTAVLTEPEHGPKGTRFGNVVDGRGNPKGTEKVVRLV